MEIQRSASPLHTEPALTHPLQADFPVVRTPSPEAKPIALSADPLNDVEGLESSLEPKITGQGLFEAEQQEVSKKKRELEVKKEALLSRSFKQMASELDDFQATHRMFAKGLENRKKDPKIAAYLNALPAFEHFNQSIRNTLTSDKTVKEKLQLLAELYCNSRELLQFLETHVPVLKAYFKENEFITRLQLHLFTHGFFLDKVDTYAGHKMGDLIAQGFQRDFEKLSDEFKDSCCALYQQSLETTTSNLSEYLQLNLDDAFPYEAARATLVAHYGRRIVDEVELSFPTKCAGTAITAAHFREMLVNVALRVKKEDLIELYHAIKNEGSDELFACMNNIPPAALENIKKSQSFDNLNYKQLDCLVSAFRSCTENGTVKVINDKLTKHIIGSELTPITKAALYFLTKSEAAKTYLQDPDDPDFALKSDYAPQEHLAREMAYALDFENITGCIFKSVSQNELSYVHVVDTLNDKGMHAHMLHPLTQDPKGATATLLFRGFKYYDLDSAKRAFLEGLEAGAKTFALLQNDLWEMFVSNLPNSDHIEVKVAGHSLGESDAGMFAECFVQRYYSHMTPDSITFDINEGYDIETQAIKKEKTNLPNIKLLQIWSLNPPGVSPERCDEYNYSRSLLQTKMEQKPIIVHNHLLVTGDAVQQANWTLHGWVDPYRPGVRYGQDPIRQWSYTDKNGKTSSLQDTRLVIATPENQITSVTTYSSHRWHCTQKGANVTRFEEIVPEKLNTNLGTTSLAVAVWNNVASTVTHNLIGNNANLLQTIYDNREPIMETVVGTTRTVLDVAYSTLNSLYASYTGANQTE